MFLSKDPNGFWYLYYHDSRGVRQKKSTGTKNKQEAYKFLRTFQIPNASTPKTNLKLSELTEHYLSHSKSHHTTKTQLHHKVALHQLQQVVGDIPIKLITSRNLEQFISLVQEKTSKWSARKYYISLAAVFQKAVEWEYLEINPFRKVKQPRPVSLKPKFLSEEQVAQIMEYIPDPEFKRLCLFALHTGLRLGELVALRWEHVSFERGIVSVENTQFFTTKSKKDRMVPLNSIAVEALGKVGEGLVFTLKGRPWNESVVNQKMRRLSKGVGFHVHFHMLRHTFASWLVQKGANLYAVKELLGHASITTTEVYAHLQPSTLHSVVNRLI